MPDHNTPLRRSGRFQPIVSAPDSVSGTTIIPSGLLHTRALLEDYQTHFYNSFTHKSERRAPIKTYGKSRARTSAVEPPIVYNVGDTVFVKTKAPNPSVAVITAVWKVEGEDISEKTPLRVRVHWFTRPSELPKYRAKKDFCENEILYNVAASVTLPATVILLPCTISSSSTAALPSRQSKDVEPAIDFFCRLACDPQKGLYYEHHWDSFREEALRALSADDHALSEVPWPNDDLWAVKLKPQPKRPRQADDKGVQGRRKRRRIARKADASGSDSQSEDGDDSADDFHASDAEESADEEEPDPKSEEDDSEDESVVSEPKTPSRKRKRGRAIPPTPKTPRTPRRPRADKGSLAHPTPHSKAALRRRKKTALAVRPPPPAEGTLELALARGLEGDAWQRAMHVLHVAARPGALPCREQEYGRVLRAVEELLEEGSGGCICRCNLPVWSGARLLTRLCALVDISGVPGTGKTATVHAVVRELKRMAEQNEANPFAYVEINGLKIPEPAAAYGLLWEAVCGHDVAKDGHMKVTSKEALRNLSKHFSGADRVGPAGGHACVVLMDELDQLMTTKQDVVYNFFNWPTLAGSKIVVLAVANTMDLPERVMTGRVRSRLGMVRINFQPYTTPQLEQIVKARLAASKIGLPSPSDVPDVIGADAIKFASMKVSSISGDARRVLDICRRTVELVYARRKTARIEDVKEVIKEMQNSPTAAYLRELSFHERLMLAALMKCVRKEGVEEIKWSEVQHQHIVYLNLLSNDAEGDPARRPSADELTLVLDSLLASHALICEDGVAIARKAEGERRIALNLEYAEVERILGEVGGLRWRNALNV
ncbi:P-loop containing nucleoside triphosphate hydrolase protein [Fomes fomentarius]|nr:P-loop containing nucleoside triphosphate hydrolase protein [Fomes fomentarius]